MADLNANIGIGFDTREALASLRKLQAGLSTFNQSLVVGNAAAANAQKGLNAQLIQSINSTGKFIASQVAVASSTQAFTNALEKNKFSLKEYYRYSMAAATANTKVLRKAFAQEREIINRTRKDRVKMLQSQYIQLAASQGGMVQALRVLPRHLATTNGQLNDYATRAQMAAQRQQLLNQLIKQGSTNLLNWGKNTQWAGRQLMVGLTLPLTMFGAFAGKVFKELEEEMVRFRRVYGDTFTDPGETEKALENIRKLGAEYTKYGVAVKDTVKMAADAAAAGFAGNELTAQVETATKLAVLGNVEQQQALETTISLSNAFGLSTQELAQKINFLNAVENQTVVAIEDLTIAIPKAGPVVKQLGGSVEDLAFFLTAMKEGGINASEGANALKSGLASLINPTDKAKGMLQEMGISIDAIVEQNDGNLREIVVDFATALDELAPLQRARAIEQLFGKFQFARLSTLFQNVTKDGNQASRVLDLTGRSVEELAIMSERELGAIEDATGKKFQAAIESLKQELVPLGKVFLEALTPVVKFFGGLIEKFNGLSEGTKRTIAIVTGVIAGIGPVVLMMVGLVANGVANLIKFFGMLRGGIAKLNGQTNILGGGFNYLTQEELENMAQSNALHTSHQNLISVFNMEKTAVMQLAEAYGMAAIQARNLATSAPGLFTTNVGAAGAVRKLPRGFSQGSASVQYYSKGTDTVPAMLTPGEAVIPVDAAQDPANKPFIEAMLEGKRVQQFNTGTPEVESQSSRKGSSKKSNFAHTAPSSKGTVNDLIASGNFRGTELERLKQLQSMGFGDTKLNQYALLGFDIDDDINRRLEKTRAYINPDTGQLNDDFKKLDAKKQAEIRKLLVTREQYLDEINRRGSIYTMARALSTNDLTPEGSQKLGTGTAIRIAADYRAEMRDAVTKFGETGKPVYITDDVTDRISKKLFDSPSERLRKSISYLLPLTRPTDFENPKATDYEKLIDSKSKGGKKEILSVKDGLKKLGKGKVRFKKGSTLLDAVKGLKNSPEHKIQLAYDKDGKIVGFSLLEKKYKGDKFTGYSRTNVGYNNNGILDTQRSSGGGRLGLYRKTTQPLDLETLSKGRFFTSDKGLVSFAADSIVEQKLKGKSETKKKKASQKIQQKAKVFKKVVKEPLVPALVAIDEELTHPRTKEKIKVTASTGIPKTSSMERIGGSPQDTRFIFAPKGTMVSRAGGGFRTIGVPGYDVAAGTQPMPPINDPRFRGAVLLDAEKINKPLEDISKNTGETGENTKETTKELTKKEKQSLARGMRAEKIGRISNPASMALGTAAMGAMMTGQSGGMIGGLMAASMVASLAPMFAMMGAGGWAMTALVTFGGGLLMLNKSAQSAAKAQSDLVDSTSATAQKMKLVGQYTDKVGATEIMSARRTGQQFTKFSTNYEREGQQFGTNFMASEVGKQIGEGFKNNLQQNRGNAIPAFANQLAGFISDGVMSLDQAQSVARQIAINFNDMTLYPKIIGQLNSIIAPNGQNILTNPLEVRMNITRTQRGIAEDITKQFDTAVSNYDPFGGWLGGKQANRSLTEIFTTTQAERLAALSSAQGAQSLETNAAQIDALTVQYEKEIRILETRKAQTTDVKEQLKIQQQIDSLNGKMASGVDRLRQLNTDILADQIKAFNIAKQRGATEGAFFDALKQQARERFKGTDMEAFVTPLLEATARLDESVLGGKAGQELEVTINTMVAAGANPLLMTQLMETFAGKEDRLKKTLELAVKTHGIDQLLALTSNLGGIKDKKLRRQLTVEINNLNKDEFVDVNSTITKLTEMAGKEFSLEVYLGNDTDKAMAKLKRLTKQMNEIENLPDPLKKSAIATIQTKAESTDPKYANSLDGVKTYWTWFKSLPDNIEKTAVQTYLTVYDTITKGEVTAEIEKNLALADKIGGLAGEAMRKQFTGPEARASARKAIALRLTQEQYQPEDLENEVPKGSSTGDGGKGSKATPFDNLLLRLKQVRDDSIKTAVGFEAIFKRVRELFKKDGGTFSEAFSGISQDLIRLGASGGFTEAVLGMDPKEWKTYKDKLFVFDDKGNIKELTALGKQLSKAYAEVTLGDFQQEQITSLRNTRAQADAFNKLRAAGVDAATAMKMIEDPITATAIASQALTADELKKIAKAAKEAADDAERLALQLNLVQKALDAEFAAKMPEVYTALARMGLSADEIRIALSDPDIAKALVEDLKDGVLNAEDLLKYINDIKKAADIELQIKMSTLEGQTELFMDGFQKAMEQFAAKEQQINIRFNFSDSKEVKQLDKTLFGKDAKSINLYNANKMMEELNEKSTYYNNGLDEISEKEKLVNEEYDKKLEALELVEKINNRIIQGQKQQLTLADALSQGDISAAAKAAQDIRGQAAEGAMEDRRSALQQARENALANVSIKIKDVTYTRKQLEDNLLQIKKQQFFLENEVILPLTKQRDLLIESITVVGKTREEWEKVKNQIDIAITTSKQYEDAMRLALSLVNQIVAGWNSLQSKQIYLDIIQRYNTQGGPTGNGEDPDVIAAAEQEYAEATAAAAEAEALAKEAAAEAANAEAEAAKAKLETATQSLELDLQTAGQLQGEVNSMLAQIKTLNKLTKSGKTKSAQKMIKNMLGVSGSGGGEYNMLAMSRGGLVPTQYLANGGRPFSIGTDTIPAMLTPGEFIVSRFGVKEFGIDKLRAINSGNYSGDSVYNYNLSVNVRSEADPNEIARTVITHIKQIDSKRLRGNKI